MNKQELSKLLNAKIQDTTVFFLKGPLSQWFPSKFTDSVNSYNCCEQYMMYQKAKLFGDEETAKQILASDNPSDQKKLGRSVSGFDENIWVESRYRIVKQGNLYKFGQNHKLLSALKLTNNMELVEANPRDRIWGIGFDAENVGPREQWGLNLLGKILMEVRSEL